MADISPRHIACAGLMVAAPLVELVEQDILLPHDDPESFWRGFEAILREMAPRNAALISRREALQKDIDAWHTANPDASADEYLQPAWSSPSTSSMTGSWAFTNRSRSSKQLPHFLRRNVQCVIRHVRCNGE